MFVRFLLLHFLLGVIYLWQCGLSLCLAIQLYSVASDSGSFEFGVRGHASFSRRAAHW